MPSKQALAIGAIAVLAVGGHLIAHPPRPTAWVRADGTMVVPKWQPPRIEAKALRARLVAGEDLVIVDVREPAEYKNAHVPGARNVHGPTIPGRLAELPADKLVVLYCTCPDDHAAVWDARNLHVKYGYDRLAVLRDGLNGWAYADLPLMQETAEPGELFRRP